MSSETAMNNSNNDDYEDDDYLGEGEDLQDNHDNNNTSERKKFNFQSLVKLCPSMTGNLLTENSADFLKLFNNDPIKQQMVNQANNTLHNKPWSFNTILFGPNSFDQTCLYRYPMFFGWSGYAQSIISRFMKGSLWNLIFNRLNSKNVEGKFKNWTSKQITIDRDGMKYYFTVLERKKMNENREKEISFFIVPDIDGAFGTNTPYIDNFVNYVCGESNPLKLAEHTKSSFKRLIIYNREGRDSTLKIINPNEFIMLGNASGLSECLADLKQKLDLNEKLFGVGWGFGANLLLKSLSLNKELVNQLFIGAISVSNPFDIHKCFKNFNNNFIYNHLLHSMKKIVELNWSTFQDSKLDLKSILNSTTISQFDNQFTMKLLPNTNQDLDDFYKEQSSCKILSNEIQIPILAIHANDDPLCAPSVFNNTVMPACLYGDNILLIKTLKGGNRAFFSSGYMLFSANISFDERIIFDFIETLPKL
ncbi:predicted protein [Naegleria gruberi]|uniref:Predicted protein n=1 Tax=Naegleria gruberi TaxID=5762 RepID=D2V3X4_NAEGR|nr:uncharacterized protein NAEGRDRAFT_63523 [Naegleria gruberi]EFC48276.1 predicted protein [Naegleria gruberi]|eukprot:XP_002681020.1 predicted protein [Naegleria gruberi strain NEG-M]